VAKFSANRSGGDEHEKLIDYVRDERLQLSQVITQTVPLDAEKISEVLDSLGRFERQIRVVITP
jgi:threonine dehydrogenase-like Zn-dependent dehydrogenase